MTSQAMPPEVLAAALDYAERGWLVVPLHSPTPKGCSCGRVDCGSPAKHPRTSHGLKDATRDPEIIRGWWTRWPKANIGLLTGPESGILVLDVDGAQGLETLSKCEAKGLRFPDTFAVATGRGSHFYFQYPTGLAVHNSAGKIGLGLDIRGMGGYVVAPPSRHSTGSLYTCAEPRKALVPAPEWLLALIEGKTKPAATPAPATGTLISKGDRTPRLVSLAGTLHKRGMSSEAITAALLAENLAKCEPPLPEDKVRAIAHEIPKRYPNAPDVRKGSGLTLVELGDLLSRPVVPVDWTWEERLAAGTMSILASKPKTGKSTLARNLCLAVARGEAFLGWECRRGSVLYLALEERLEDVAADFRTLGANGSEDIRFSVGGTVLDVLALLQDTKPTLLVVDPLFRLVNVRDEKAYAEVYAALGPLIDVARACGTHILALHHSSKLAKAEAIDAPIGSTALGGAVSTLMVMRRTDAYRTLETVQRLGHDLPETVLRFDATTKKLTLGDSREQAEVDNVASHILAALGIGCMTEEEIDDAVEGRTTLLRTALRQLVESGSITRDGKGKKGSPYLYRVACFHVPDPMKKDGNKHSEVESELQFEKVVPDVQYWCGNKQTRNEKNPESGAKSTEMLVPDVLGVKADSETAGNKLSPTSAPEAWL